MIDYIALGKCIRKCRKEQGLTQAKLAEMIDISPNHISKVENGTTKPSLQVFVDIADALNVPMDQLMLRNPNKSVTGSSTYADKVNQIFDSCTAKQKVSIIQILEELNAMFQTDEHEDSE